MEFVHEDDARGEDVPIALQANYMARNIATVYDGAIIMYSMVRPQWRACMYFRNTISLMKLFWYT